MDSCRSFWLFRIILDYFRFCFFRYAKQAATRPEAPSSVIHNARRVVCPVSVECAARADGFLDDGVRPAWALPPSLRHWAVSWMLPVIVSESNGCTIFPSFVFQPVKA